MTLQAIEGKVGEQLDVSVDGSKSDEHKAAALPSARPAPRAKSDLHQGLILLAEGYIENAVAAERFRILRAKIERLNLGEKRYKVLVVTSAVPSEGKSVVAVNLARALSIDPLGKTLLIDCDLRKPTVQKFFRTARESGLSDALFHRKMNNKFIRAVAPGLDVITSGTAVVDPTEAIEQPDFERFVTEMREYYRYIIIDCPPVLLCPEPIRISAVADATLLVARAWRTNRNLVKEAVEVIGQQKILGIVLNDGLDSSHKYSDYGYYSYYSRQKES